MQLGVKCSLCLCKECIKKDSPCINGTLNEYRLLFGSIFLFFEKIIKEKELDVSTWVDSKNLILLNSFVTNKKLIIKRC